MKKIIISAVVLIAIEFLFSSAALADHSPPGDHRINRCVKIVNLQDFPQLVLIGKYDRPILGVRQMYQIENNECLPTIYFRPLFKIYWNTKDKADLIDSTKMVSDSIETYSKWAFENNHLIHENIEYSIAGFSASKLILFKSKQISEYNNGEPAKIETFENPLGKKEANKNDSDSASSIIQIQFNQSDTSGAFSPGTSK